MKRARIKAMVTVPTRRKVTQDATVTEVANVHEHNVENKNTCNDSCIRIEQTAEAHVEEKQAKECVRTIEHTQNKQLHVEHEDNEYKDASQSLVQLPKDIGQRQEVLNTVPHISPTKVPPNRLGFMRPIPKFDGGSRVRRNSMQGSGTSASESEDDSRKVTNVIINHTENESVQLSQSAKDISANNMKNNVIASKVGPKKRIPLSESARKLVEARREFHLKHENKTPDRNKLTMYDLIYYNPVTNPMKSKASTPITKKRLESLSEEIQEEQNEDDPSSAMPVPQVKVGPNGQLIIDEQSLVIEHTDAKKNREVLAKEAIIDDDISGSGFYKRRQKSKEWSKLETLKFYKALNTVGTDFLLMQSLFPNRTRQEIKLKFKKEERINRDLVEKVLAYHQEFDTEVLEKSLATFENSIKEHDCIVERQKQQRIKDRKNLKSRKRRKSRIVASSIVEMDASGEDDDLNSIIEGKASEECQQALTKSSKNIYKRSKDEKSVLETSTGETNQIVSLSLHSSFNSDVEEYSVRPTRSRRLPKIKKLQGPDINSLENLNNCPNNYEMTMPPEDNLEATEKLVIDHTHIDLENHETNSIKTVIPNIGNVEPGSLVILSKESLEEPGKSVLQVYMVSSGVNSQDLEKSAITPVNISPELLATVTAKLSDGESVDANKEYE